MSQGQPPPQGPPTAAWEGLATGGCRVRSLSSGTTREPWRVPGVPAAPGRVARGCPTRPAVHGTRAGLDHGVGHSLLLLYDVKVPNGQKSKEFKDLGHYPSNTSLGAF